MGLMEGRLAVITAGTAGIGRAVAERFIAEGADVVVTSPNAEEITEAVASLGEHAIGVVGDAGDVDSLAALAASVRELGRPVDSLFINAGRDVDATAILDTTPAQFDAVMDLNVRGAFFTASAIVPLMRDGGTIVLTSSIAGSNGGPGHATYNASKAAVRSLARTLTAELRDRRIRANAISPGPTATAGFAKFTGGDPAVEQQIITMLPVGHVGLPSEVAAAVLFLASDESSYIAGAELVVDGGMSQV